jgi:hypothetical protein
MNSDAEILAKLSRASSVDRHWALSQLTSAEREALQRLLQPEESNSVENPVQVDCSTLDLPSLATRLMSEPLWFQRVALRALDEPIRSTLLQWMKRQFGMRGAAANIQLDSMVLTESMIHAVTGLLQSVSGIPADVVLTEKRTSSRFDRLVRRFQGGSA